MAIPPAKHAFWSTWARILQQKGLAGATASLIEAASPFGFVCAQMIYLGQPLFGSIGPESSLQAMAELLENRTELRDFAAFLREESSP